MAYSRVADLSFSSETRLVRVETEVRGKHSAAWSRHDVMATIAWLGILLTSVPWYQRDTATPSGQGEFLKLAVWLLALTIAFSVHTRNRHRTLTLPLAILLMYASVSVLGALLGTATSASLQRSAYLALTVLAISSLTAHLGMQRILFGFIGFAAVVTGTSLAAYGVGAKALTDGRLGGYLPPLHPNHLGLLAAITIGCSALLWAVRSLRTQYVVPITALGITVLFMSGSRTSLLALGAMLPALLLPAARVRGFVALWCVAVVATSLALFQPHRTMLLTTDVVTRRGTVTATANLESRMRAWQAVQAQASRSTAGFLVGHGLATKRVSVRNRYVTKQTVDSTWYSAFLQTGAFGVGLLAIALGLLAYRTLRAQSPVPFAVVSAAAVASFFESHLNDVTLLFAIYVAVAACLPRLPSVRQPLLVTQSSNGPRPRPRLTP